MWGWGEGSAGQGQVCKRKDQTSDPQIPPKAQWKRRPTVTVGHRRQRQGILEAS